jgi:tRNA threonylcarbamoyladenosine biosynthesis protein TsaE
MNTWQINSTADLDPVAQEIALALRETPLAVFVGEMGAGKTTLISAICHALGVTDSVSSPTYGLVNTYAFQLPDGSERQVHHLDLYRIQSVYELLSAGIAEVFHSDAIVLVEWPQVAEGLIPQKRLVITIEATSATQRKISLDVQNAAVGI